MFHFRDECYSDSHAIDQGVFAAGFLRLAALEEQAGIASCKARKSLVRDYAQYVRSSLNTIGRTIWVRYDGPCDDDDAIVYFEHALPFLVELAVIEGRPNRVQSITWASRNSPSLIQGIDGLADDDDRAWFQDQELRAVNSRFDYARCNRGFINLPKG